MTDALEALGLSVEYVPFRVELYHPETGAPLTDENGDQAWIEIEGYNSPAGEKLTRQAKLKMQQQQRGGRQSKDLDLDKAREENADALAHLTKSWFLVNAKTGKAIAEADFPCTYANAKALYAAKDRAWIASALGAALLEQSNFIKT